MLSKADGRLSPRQRTINNKIALYVSVDIQLFYAFGETEEKQIAIISTFVYVKSQL